MASELAKILGPLEAKVVEVLWDLDRPVAVREVLDRLNDTSESKLAYTTIMTVMSRLAEKGVLERKAQGRGYVYEAAVRDAAELAVRNVVRDFGDAAVAHFLDEARADPKLLRRLRGLMEQER